MLEYWSHGCAAPDKNHQLGNRLLGRWWLGQGGGGAAPRGGGGKSPETSGMNNCYILMGAQGLWKKECMAFGFGLKNREAGRILVVTHIVIIISLSYPTSQSWLGCLSVQWTVSTIFSKAIH